MLVRMRTCPEVKVHALVDKLCIYHPSADLLCPAGGSQSRSDSGRFARKSWPTPTGDWRPSAGR